MNSFYNPLILYHIAKNYLSDMQRLWTLKQDELKRYQDNAFRAMVKFAYTVPLYHEKYKIHGVHHSDISGIDDIHKLPFITKDDLRNNYPDKIISNKFNKKNGNCISTSGSTGKPVFIYVDKLTSIRSIIAFARVLKAYQGNWRKSKTLLILDIGPGSIEHSWFEDSAVPFLKKFIKLNNIKYLDIGEKPEQLIKKINTFNPEFIGSDPNMLRQLAYLKLIGKGKDTIPTHIFSGGSVLDTYTKQYVEKAFNAKVVDTYGTTEGGPLAFQCAYENYHVHSDFVYLEFLDKQNNSVSYNSSGHVVVTKLYGRGTPIIRYTGIDDFVTPVESKCPCNIPTTIIKQIDGRSTDMIVLPNSQTISPLTITGIPAKIMEEYNSYIIKQFQLIQHKIDEIEMLVIIDEKQKNTDITVNDLFNELKKRISEKIGEEIKVNITQVNEIQKDIRSDYVKVMISKIHQ